MVLTALACSLLGQVSTAVFIAQVPAAVARLLVEVRWGHTEPGLSGEKRSCPSKGLMNFIFYYLGLFYQLTLFMSFARAVEEPFFILPSFSVILVLSVM